VREGEGGDILIEEDVKVFTDERFGTASMLHTRQIPTIDPDWVLQQEGVYFIPQWMVLYNVAGYLISSDHQLYRVTPLETPFRSLLLLIQSQSHVTTITIISYAVTRLHNYNSYTFVITISDFHSYTFTQFTNTTL
jgi:hypothetical protein